MCIGVSSNGQPSSSAALHLEHRPIAVVRHSAQVLWCRFADLCLQPLAATVNYVAGDIRGNLAIVPLDSDPAGDDISIFTFAETHVVGDIVGYFIAPQATGLDCTATFVTQNVAANGIFNFPIPACPVSYAVTGAGCRTPGFNEANFAINGLYWNNGAVDTYCSGQNTTAGVITVEGTAQCCRVPGR